MQHTPLHRRITLTLGLLLYATTTCSGTDSTTYTQKDTFYKVHYKETISEWYGWWNTRQYKSLYAHQDCTIKELKTLLDKPDIVFYTSNTQEEPIKEEDENKTIENILTTKTKVDPQDLANQAVYTPSQEIAFSELPEEKKIAPPSAPPIVPLNDTTNNDTGNQENNNRTTPKKRTVPTSLIIIGIICLGLLAAIFNKMKPPKKKKKKKKSKKNQSKRETH